MKKSDRSRASTDHSAKSTAPAAAIADRSALSPATCLIEAARLCRFLPRSLRLTLGERLAAGGYVFVEAPRLVRAVAEAIEQRPALFADLPVQPARMRHQVLLAFGFHAVHSILQDLADRAKDGYLRYLGAATKDAMLVVRCVRTDALRPIRSPDQEARIDLMTRAEQVLAARRQRKQRSGDRSKKLAAAQVALPKKPREQPARRAMKELLKADLAQKAAEVARNLAGRRQ